MNFAKAFATSLALTYLATALGAGTAQAQELLANGPHSIAEQYLFNKANEEREQRGLPTLRWDSSLYLAANNHAREMAARESISHQYPGESELATRGKLAGAHFSVISENVAEAPTAVWIHDAWMKSEGHRKNLLDPDVDSVAIRVLSRNGQLYAVEDFDHSVQNLSLDAQEHAVDALLKATSSLNVLPSTADARRTCSMETGYAGQREPWFIMRYTAGDLTRLPDQLKTKLMSGKYHQAVVGACDAHNTEAFTAYNIAVLLYP
jgi:uncharacterized protein YkwD